MKKKINSQLKYYLVGGKGNQSLPRERKNRERKKAKERIIGTALLLLGMLVTPGTLGVKAALKGVRKQGMRCQDPG